MQGDQTIESYFNIEIPDGKVLPKFESEQAAIIEKISDVSKFYTKQDLINEV